MCGRFSLAIDAELFEKIFGIINISNYKPSYNIAPGQNIGVIRINNNSQKELSLMHWGLIPSWSKDPKVGYKMINARSETLTEKPSFKQSFKTKRCLIPADGFYEWKKQGKEKTPYYFKMKNSSPFAFAGLWDTWINKEDTKTIDSCTIITTSANSLLNPIHERMPVILNPENYSFWLDNKVINLDKLKSVLNSYDSDTMLYYEVSKNINSSKINEPSLILPAYK